MTTVIEDGGRTNIYAKEPPIEIMDITETHNEKAEKLNGRLAMLGVMAALGAYAITGQIIPGVWWCLTVKELTVQKKVVPLKRERKNNG